jgi:hypothetical protein
MADARHEVSREDDLRRLKSYIPGNHLRTDESCLP